MGEDVQHCVLCGTELQDQFLIAHSLDSLEGPSYRYLHCRTCGLVSLELLAEHHIIDCKDSGYYSPRPPIARFILDPILQRVEQTRLETITRLVPDLLPGRALDIGSGKGRFLRCLGAKGWEAIGLEPLQRDPKEAIDGITVVHEYLKPDLWDAEFFDLITLWHTLEHLPDPLWALCVAHRWLRPQGAIAVAVPNLDSWQAYLGKAKWFHLDPPRHLHHFSPPVLKHLLEVAEFRKVQITFPPFDLSLLGMVQTVLNLTGLSPNLLYNFLKRNKAGLPRGQTRLFAELVLCSVVLLILLLPALALTEMERWRGYGGIILAVGRKE